MEALHAGLRARHPAPALSTGGGGASLAGGASICVSSAAARARDAPAGATAGGAGVEAAGVDESRNAWARRAPNSSTGVRAMEAGEGGDGAGHVSPSSGSSSWNEGGPAARASAARASLSASGVPSARPSPKIQRDAKSDMPSGANTDPAAAGARHSRRAMRATCGRRRSATRIASRARGA